MPRTPKHPRSASRPPAPFLVGQRSPSNNARGSSTSPAAAHEAGRVRHTVPGTPKEHAARVPRSCIDAGASPPPVHDRDEQLRGPRRRHQSCCGDRAHRSRRPSTTVPRANSPSRQTSRRRNRQKNPAFPRAPLRDGQGDPRREWRFYLILTLSGEDDLVRLLRRGRRIKDLGEVPLIPETSRGRPKDSSSRQDDRGRAERRSRIRPSVPCAKNVPQVRLTCSSSIHPAAASTKQPPAPGCLEGDDHSPER